MKVIKQINVAIVLSALLASMFTSGLNAIDTRSCCQQLVKAQKVITNQLCAGNGNFNGNVHVGGDVTIDGTLNKALEIANVTQGLREARAFPDVPDAISWSHGVAYQIIQQGFWDGDNNGLGMGSINGITERLDYLSDLGIEAIWITQPTLGASYYGFNTVDAKLIDPATGTNDDLADLVKAAHERNIKVIMGSVWHQTSVEHPFFQEALNGNPSYMDRYHLEIDPPQGFNIFFGDLWQSVKVNFPGSPLAQQPENWYYRSKFGADVADTNLYNPVMLDWVVDFSKYWISKGIDGFRIDVAISSQISGLMNGEYVNGIDPNDHTDQLLVRRIRQIKPDTFFLAEVFVDILNPDGSVNAIESGAMFGGARIFGGVSDFQTYALLRSLLGNNNGQFFLDQYINNILPSAKSFTDVTFLENHDVARFISRITISDEMPPTPSLDAPPSYAPAPAGAFRIHYDKESLPPALQDNNMNLYYFSGAGGSNPFPTGSVNNLATPPGNVDFPFLGGGNDDFGPYWDFPLNYFSDFGDDRQFGFIVIEKNNYIKVSGDINIYSEIANPIILAGQGDIFVRGLQVPTEFPTTAQLNHVQTFYGLLLALPGSPMLWQGQEQGMQSAIADGISDSTREPVVWSTEGTQVKGFNPYNLPSGVAAPGYENLFSTPETVRPPDVTNPLWVYMRDAIRARRDSVALKQGTLEVLTLPGNPATDVVTIFDEGSDSVTAADVVAFSRSINNWPVYCVFNFGATPKTVEVRGGLLVSCDIDFLFTAANLPPQIYYSHNVELSPVENPNCDPYIITMPQYSSVVFTPIQFFGIPNGNDFQNLPACCF